MTKNLVFDLDGTLVESAPDIHDAVNKCLSDNDHDPLSLEKVTSFIGNGVPKLIEHVMKAANIEYTAERHVELTNIFSAHYGRNPVSLSYLNKGSRGALEQLYNDGYKMAICTNKPLELTQQVLSGFGITHYFQAVIGGDSLEVKKPDRAPLEKAMELMGESSCIYIGDSEVDAQTAQNAKQPFFLFTDGYRTVLVEELKADAVFDDFAKLPLLLREYKN